MAQAAGSLKGQLVGNLQKPHLPAPRYPWTCWSTVQRFTVSGQSPRFSHASLNSASSSMLAQGPPAKLQGWASAVVLRFQERNKVTRVLPPPRRWWSSQTSTRRGPWSCCRTAPTAATVTAAGRAASRTRGCRVPIRPRLPPGLVGASRLCGPWDLPEGQ